MLLYWDSKMIEHRTGQHPESPARLESLHEVLKREGWLQRSKCPSWQPATSEQLVRVHSKEYLEKLPKLYESNAGRIEADTVVSTKSYVAATIAAGAVCDAVERVVRGEAKQAFCAIRPPGHHAIPKGPMGFCLLNNVAVGALHALHLGLERILIVDWDVHHGNGTQDTFYRDSRVAFFSSHRFPFILGQVERTKRGKGRAWMDRQSPYGCQYRCQRCGGSDSRKGRTIGRETQTSNRPCERWL